MNVLALTPLLERFEAEYGTLTTLALFLGRKCSPILAECVCILADVLISIPALSTIPALLYTFVERGILRMNTTVLGARYGTHSRKEQKGRNANSWFQHMGVHSACHGGCQDIQDEPALHVGRYQNTYVDNASYPGLICLLLGSKYQLSGACLRTAVRLWMFVPPNSFPANTKTNLQFKGASDTSNSLHRRRRFCDG